jgi:hypothetical protein
MGVSPHRTVRLDPPAAELPLTSAFALLRLADPVVGDPRRAMAGALVLVYRFVLLLVGYVGSPRTEPPCLQRDASRPPNVTAGSSGGRFAFPAINSCLATPNVTTRSRRAALQVRSQTAVSRARFLQTPSFRAPPTPCPRPGLTPYTVLL